MYRLESVDMLLKKRIVDVSPSNFPALHRIIHSELQDAPVDPRGWHKSSEPPQEMQTPWNQNHLQLQHNATRESFLPRLCGWCHQSLCRLHKLQIKQGIAEIGKDFLGILCWCGKDTQGSCSRALFCFSSHVSLPRAYNFINQARSALPSKHCAFTGTVVAHVRHSHERACWGDSAQVTFFGCYHRRKESPKFGQSFMKRRTCLAIQTFASTFTFMVSSAMSSDQLSSKNEPTWITAALFTKTWICPATLLMGQQKILTNFHLHLGSKVINILAFRQVNLVAVQLQCLVLL